MGIKQIFSKLSVITVLTLSFAANADPIAIEVLEGGDTPETLGGFVMTQFDTPAIPGSGCGHYSDGVYSTDSPISGQVDFEARDGSPLCMSVQDPDWWEYEDHSNVFTTSVPWVELIMPENTRAFSLWVGASFTGRGWIEASDGDNATLQYFGGKTGITLGWDNTPGFGVYTTGSCSTITKIIVEPSEWGTGNFAINQDPCVSVPEPAPIGLLALGLLGLGLSRKFQIRKSEIRT